MTKKIRIGIYVALYLMLMAICIAMGVFSASDVKIGLYTSIFYQYSPEIISSTNLLTAYNNESQIYFGTYDSNDNTKCVISGGVHFTSRPGRPN